MKGVEATFGGRPIALYDADRQLCFAIFENARVCGKYVFPEKNSALSSQYVYSYLMNKTCRSAKNNHIGVKLAFRLANDEQIKFLKNDFAVLLAEGYPEIKFNIGIGYHSTAAELTKECKRFIGQRRIKVSQIQQYTGS